MTYWLRRLRLALGLFVVLFAVGLVFALRPKPPRTAPPEVARVDPNAVVEMTRSGEARNASGDRQTARFQFDTVATYQNGVTKFTHVVIPADPEAGRHYTVTADEAEVGKDQSSYLLRGHVRLSGKDGMTLEAEEATYNETEQVLRVPGRVNLARGPMRGSATGLTYDQARDVVTLVADATMTMPAEGEQPATDINAGRATWARRDGYMLFQEQVKVVRGAQTTEADEATVYLTEDEQQIRSLELRGHARITATGGGAGAFRAMQAASMDLTYAAAGERLEYGMLVGGAVLELAGDAGGPGRRLTAEWIEFGLAPDGSTVTVLNARDTVRLDLPQDGASKTPARIIAAQTLASSGPPERGITSARFEGGVQFSERAAGAATARVARAQRLDVVMAPGFGGLEDATFLGGVRFDDGDITAVARDARYLAAKGELVLPAGKGSGERPRVTLADATIEAASIDMGLDRRTVRARGNVTSVLRPAAPGTSKAGSGEATRVPALLEQDQPTYASSRELAYDDANRRAEYTGDARIWQTGTRIAADRITLDHRNGDLHAASAAPALVTSQFELEETDEKTRKPRTTRTKVEARELVYEDGTRRATYTTAAHMSGGEEEVSAERLVLQLDARGKALERADATTGVSVKEGGRAARGDRMTYFAADGKYEMTGNPVRIVHESRETTGKTLTFYRSTDRIVIDGNDQTRTQTKPGDKSGAPNLD